MNILSKKLQIIKNEEVAQGWYEMEFDCGLEELSEFHPRPGQFISVSFPEYTFRRPFAVSKYIQQKSFSILYQVCDPYFTPTIHNTQRMSATQKMSHLQPQDDIDVMGVHGNTFSIPPSEHQPILVAGGIGLGPLLYFSEYLCEHSTHSPILIVGASTASVIPHRLLDRLRHRERISLHITTDDGSMGTKGTSIDQLRSLSSGTSFGHTQPVVYLCGPLAMMRAGAQYTAEYDITCWASLDTMMACAMGACVACVAPIIERGDTAQDSGRDTVNDAHNITWTKVCTQGPIFKCADISWDHMASH